MRLLVDVLNASPTFLSTGPGFPRGSFPDSFRSLLPSPLPGPFVLEDGPRLTPRSYRRVSLVATLSQRRPGTTVRVRGGKEEGSGRPKTIRLPPSSDSDSSSPNHPSSSLPLPPPFTSSALVGGEGCSVTRSLFWARAASSVRVRVCRLGQRRREDHDGSFGREGREEPRVSESVESRVGPRLGLPASFGSPARRKETTDGPDPAG